MSFSLTKQKSLLLFITVIVLKFLSGAEMDLYLPSFPEIQRVFQLTPFMVELSLSSNLIANCLMCLVVGDLGDRYGRKPLIAWGMLVFLLASLMCATAQSYEMLICGRILQGIGMAPASVLAYAIVADSYSPKRQQEMIGWINGSVTLGVALAPTIGSYIALWFHWRGNFVALLCLGILCLILTMLFVPHQKKALPVVKPGQRVAEYKAILTSKKSMYYVLSVTFLTMTYWSFLSISPILYMETLGVSLEHFGYYQGATCFIYAIGSFTVGWAFKKFGQRRCFYFGMLLLVAFLVGDLFLIVTDVKSPLLITLTLMVQLLGAVYPVTLLWPLYLDTFPKAKGKLSALQITVRMVLLSSTAQLMGYFYNDSFVFIGWVLAVLQTLALIFLYLLSKQGSFFEHREA